jgi:D-alanyl-D-alanine carboxypeptidase/D-alanyl-D-alanine-endopeptidase (penicillin-binding protein 4)
VKGPTVPSVDPPDPATPATPPEPTCGNATAALPEGPSRARRPGRIAARALLCTLVILSLLAAPLAEAGAATIQERITAILQANGMAGWGTGVSVYDRDDGEPVYGRRTTTRFAPASNMKLVTAATALTHWPADHRFQTALFFTRELEPYSDTFVGDVYLKGYGDPAFSTVTYQKERLGIRTGSIQEMVAFIKSLGIRRIRGHVYGDATWFDAKRVVSSWSSHLYQECGPLSALSLNENWYEGKRVEKPPLHVARRLTVILERNGVDVTGGPRAGKVPSGSDKVHVVYSAPLSTLLKVLMKDSDNFFAEMLVKGLGRDFRDAGTTEAGLRVSRATLRAFGIARTRFVVADGSGLSYSDRLTTGGILRLLRTMRERPEWATFRASLAIAGYDGTLRKRMVGTAAARNFRGKTGTLRIASCLSGYETTANGHRVMVAMMMNGYPLNTYAARRAQDQIAIALAKAKL